MLAESALCLAFDDNPPTAGQVTTAQAMGDALTARLQVSAGIRSSRCCERDLGDGDRSRCSRPTVSGAPPW